MSELEFDESGLENYITSPELETHGVWLQFPNGREFLVLRTGGANKAYSRAVSAAIRPYAQQIKRGTLQNEIAENLLLELFCKHVIKDWKGILDKAGREIPFSPSTAKTFFKRYPELYKDVQELANEHTIFAERRLEEGKASAKDSSAGSSNTEVKSNPKS